MYFYRLVVGAILVTSVAGCTSEHDKLLDAIRNKDSAKVAALLENDDIELEPGSSKHDVNKPLAFAAAYGNLEIVKMLVTRGADLDGAVAYGDVPLIKADEHGNSEIAKYLIEEGANVNAPNSFGITPFIGFCAQGNIDLVRLGFEHGADVNKRFRSTETDDGQFNFSPLEASVFHGKEDVVRFLLSKQADSTIKDLKGNSLLEIAEKKGFDEITKLLRSEELGNR